MFPAESLAKTEGMKKDAAVPVPSAYPPKRLPAKVCTIIGGRESGSGSGSLFFKHDEKKKLIANTITAQAGRRTSPTLFIMMFIIWFTWSKKSGVIFLIK